MDWITLADALPLYNDIRERQGRRAVGLSALSKVVSACGDTEIAFKPGGGLTSTWLVNRDRLGDLIPPRPGRRWPED